MAEYDTKQVIRERTKLGKLATTAIGVPFFDIGIVPWERLTGSVFKAVFVEFAATMLFVYLATGAVCFGCHSASTSTSSSGTAQGSGQAITPTDCFLDSSRLLGIATSFGMAIFVLVYAAAAFSGGHLNPAVTLAFFLTKKLSAIRAAMYLAAQIAGAIVGSFLVKYTDLTGFSAATGATNRLLPGLPQSAAWLLETILTFTLIYVIFVATDQKRGQSTAHVPMLAPLAIGFTVFACHLAAIPLDGCSINPARSFGPAVASGSWTDQWVFWVGPLGGAFIAAMTYELTFRPSKEPILTIDRHDDSAQTNMTIKMPGYAGVAGLDSNEEAMDILSHRANNPDLNNTQDIMGSGHVLNDAPSSTGGAQGRKGRPSASLV